MRWKTHLLAGVSSGVLVGSLAYPDTAFAIGGLAGVAALIVDIDDPESKIGHQIPILPTVLKVTAGHRGPFHSLLFVLISSIILSIIGNIFIPLPLGALFWAIFAGELSHVLIDCLNPAGCPLLWPNKYRFRIPLISVDGLVEKFIVTPALFIVTVYVCVQAMPAFLAGLKIGGLP